MKLVHYFQRVLRGPIQCDAQGARLTGMGKPNGFWVTTDDGHNWAIWCRNERFRLEGLRYQYQIHLDPAYPILLIDTGEKLQWLTRTFGVQPEWADPRYGYSSFVDIDWVSIAWAWAGIIIAPYQWEYRLNLMWYYGWDCASGVVWNEDAIVGYERIK